MIKININEKRKNFKVQGQNFSDFIESNNMLVKNLIFNNERLENNLRIIDLVDEENILVEYKNLSCKLKQNFEFELDTTPDFYDNMIKTKFKDYDYTGKTIIDAGACCGLDTIYFSNIVGKKGKVISLEPDSTNYRKLKFNVENNNTNNNITLLNKALNYYNGFVEFSDEGSQGGMIVGKSIDTISKEDLIDLRNSKKIKIACLTINDLINSGYKPDIIKIDIEGAEYDLIKNNSFELACDCKAIFIFELHSINRCQKQINDLKDYFLKKNYSYEIFNDKILGLHYGFYPN